MDSFILMPRLLVAGLEWLIDREGYFNFSHSIDWWDRVEVLVVLLLIPLALALLYGWGQYQLVRRTFWFHWPLPLLAGWDLTMSFFGMFTVTGFDVIDWAFYFLYAVPAFLGMAVGWALAARRNKKEAAV